jgi:chloride channel 3/4/5
MTAIDWIFEYTKERQRLRVLYSSATGFLGYIRQLLDSSQMWIILIATGIAAGMIAAGIDIASNWLGDLKTGYCQTGADGGKFYLNKYFCCWGHEERAACQDWVPWSKALHVRSRGGVWIVEYIFFVLYSVGLRSHDAGRLIWFCILTSLGLPQVLFASCASFLVKVYAIYAKHSGIPEIKTVLGGFVIRRFMGAWTLVIKSLGLVSHLLTSTPEG